MSSVEERLADALGVRAELERAEAGLLRQRRTELAATAAEDVTALDTGVDHDDALAPVLGLDDARARRRRRLAAVVAATAAAVLAAVTAGALLLAPGGTAGPAAGAAQEAFPVLRTPVAPDQLLDPVEVESHHLVPGSERRLLVTAAATYWVGLGADGQVCLLAVTPGGVGGSTCGRPWQDDPLRLEVTDRAARVQAALVAPGTDTRSLATEGWVPVSDELWASSQTAYAAAEADVRAASADTFAIAPTGGSGTLPAPPLSVPGEYAVVVRCLTTSPVTVAVDGVALEREPGVPLCGGSWPDPAGTVVGSFTVGQAPVTVQVRAPAGAEWEAGVVRCTPAARQCPSSPGGTTPG